MTDVIEAQSMGYRQDLIDIYSASWGPTDDGKTCDGPRKLTMRSIVQGVNKVWAGLGHCLPSPSDNYNKNRVYYSYLLELIWLEHPKH